MSAGQAGSFEIEVTPAMILAGESVVYDLRDVIPADALAVRVYRAMETARMCCDASFRSSPIPHLGEDAK